jgi:PKD repeat protein
MALYHEEVLADSPLLYVRFEEPSGATCANDGSLGGNATAIGTYTRNVTGGAAGLGKAISLGGDAATDAVTYPDHASLDITGDVTYECWVKISSYASDQSVMTKGSDSSSVGGYLLRVLTSRQLRIVQAGVAVLGTSTGTIPNDSGWHHIAFTRSGNTYTFYIDGAAAGSFTDSTTINATTVDFQIGREAHKDDHFSKSRPLLGSIDEVAVYNTALSAARIQAHYDARANVLVAPVAAFSGTPTTGPAPLTVQFTDESTGSPTAWDWDFGDTNTSTQQHPEHEYDDPGSYDVELEVTNAGGSDDEVKAGYITVTGPPPPIEGFSVAFDDPTLEPDPTWTRLA